MTMALARRLAALLAPFGTGIDQTAPETFRITIGGDGVLINGDGILI